MITVTLTAYNMGPDATEADFDDFVSFVADRIDDRTGLDVTVEQFAFTGSGQAKDRISGVDDERPIREALAALWDDWCACSAYTLTGDGGARKEIVATGLDDAREQAHAWAMEVDYGDSSSTIWVDTAILGSDGDRLESVTTAIDPTEPDCLVGEEHNWREPHELVGGLEENPGVHGHGGGVTITSACVRCGCQRVRDTWAQRPDTGEQGLESVTYTEGVYDVEASS